ncbi:MAG: ankyrin repeat domain-containing protein, partial [Candidatus Magasanikbacteria bacterium]|nr:ankyrin repeat domain-containing protein [Candidatus Magasanikbacteria bacterium]
MSGEEGNSQLLQEAHTEIKGLVEQKEGQQSSLQEVRERFNTVVDAEVRALEKKVVDVTGDAKTLLQEIQTLHSEATSQGIEEYKTHVAEVVEKIEALKRQVENEGEISGRDVEIESLVETDQEKEKIEVLTLENESQEVKDFLKKFPDSEVVNQLGERSVDNECKVLREAKEVTLGDAHGSALKILHGLVSAGFVESMPSDFFVLYKEMCEEVTPSLAGVKEGVQDFIAKRDESKLKRLIGMVGEIEFRKVEGRKFRLIGDVIMDRGLSDRVTFELLAKLREKIGKENLVILNSNHDMGVLAKCLAVEKKEEDQSALLPEYYTFRGMYVVGQFQSGLEFFGASGFEYQTDENEKSIKELIKDHFSNVKLIDYSEDESGNITDIYTHAPIGQLMFGDMAKLAGCSKEVNTRNIKEIIRAINDMHDRAVGEILDEEKETSEETIAVFDAIKSFVWDRPEVSNERFVQQMEHRTFLAKLGIAHHYGHTDTNIDPNNLNIRPIDSEFGKEELGEFSRSFKNFGPSVLSVTGELRAAPQLARNLPEEDEPDLSALFELLEVSEEHTPQSTTTETETVRGDTLEDMLEDDYNWSSQIPDGAKYTFKDWSARGEEKEEDITTDVCKESLESVLAEISEVNRSITPYLLLDQEGYTGVSIGGDSPVAILEKLKNYQEIRKLLKEKAKEVYARKKKESGLRDGSFVLLYGALVKLEKRGDLLFYTGYNVQEDLFTDFDGCFKISEEQAAAYERIREKSLNELDVEGITSAFGGYEYTEKLLEGFRSGTNYRMDYNDKLGQEIKKFLESKYLEDGGSYQDLKNSDELYESDERLTQDDSLDFEEFQPHDEYDEEPYRYYEEHEQEALKLNIDLSPAQVIELLGENFESYIPFALDAAVKAATSEEDVDFYTATLNLFDRITEENFNALGIKGVDFDTFKSFCVQEVAPKIAEQIQEWVNYEAQRVYSTQPWLKKAKKMLFSGNPRRKALVGACAKMIGKPMGTVLTLAGLGGLTGGAIGAGVGLGAGRFITRYVQRMKMSIQKDMVEAKEIFAEIKAEIIKRDTETEGSEVHKRLQENMSQNMSAMIAQTMRHVGKGGEKANTVFIQAKIREQIKEEMEAGDSFEQKDEGEKEAILDHAVAELTSQLYGEYPANKMMQMIEKNAGLAGMLRKVVDLRSGELLVKNVQDEGEKTRLAAVVYVGMGALGGAVMAGNPLAREAFVGVAGGLTGADIGRKADIYEAEVSLVEELTQGKNNDLSWVENFLKSENSSDLSDKNFLTSIDRLRTIVHLEPVQENIMLRSRIQAALREYDREFFDNPNLDANKALVGLKSMNNELKDVQEEVVERLREKKSWKKEMWYGTVGGALSIVGFEMFSWLREEVSGANTDKEPGTRATSEKIEQTDNIKEQKPTSSVAREEKNTVQPESTKIISQDTADSVKIEEVESQTNYTRTYTIEKGGSFMKAVHSFEKAHKDEILEALGVEDGAPKAEQDQALHKWRVEQAKNYGADFSKGNWVGEKTPILKPGDSIGFKIENGKPVVEVVKAEASVEEGVVSKKTEPVPKEETGDETKEFTPIKIPEGGTLDKAVGEFLATEQGKAYIQTWADGHTEESRAADAFVEQQGIEKGDDAKLEARNKYLTGLIKRDAAQRILGEQINSDGSVTYAHALKPGELTLDNKGELTVADESLGGKVTIRSEAEVAADAVAREQSTMKEGGRVIEKNYQGNPAQSETFKHLPMTMKTDAGSTLTLGGTTPEGKAFYVLGKNAYDINGTPLGEVVMGREGGITGITQTRGLGSLNIESRAVSGGQLSGSELDKMSFLKADSVEGGSAGTNKDSLEVDTKQTVLSRDLIRAAKRGNMQSIEAFIDGGGDVNARSDIGGKTLLHHAVSEGKPDTVLRLIRDHGANVNAQANNGVTPLDLVLKNNNLADLGENTEMRNVYDYLKGSGALTHHEIAGRPSQEVLSSQSSTETKPEPAPEPTSEPEPILSVTKEESVDSPTVLKFGDNEYKVGEEYRYLDYTIKVLQNGKVEVFKGGQSTDYTQDQIKLVLGKFKEGDLTTEPTGSRSVLQGDGQEGVRSENTETNLEKHPDHDHEPSHEAVEINGHLSKSFEISGLRDSIIQSNLPASQFEFYKQEGDFSHGNHTHEKQFFVFRKGANAPEGLTRIYLTATQLNSSPTGFPIDYFGPGHPGGAPDVAPGSVAEIKEVLEHEFHGHVKANTLNTAEFTT